MANETEDQVPVAVAIRLKARTEETSPNKANKCVIVNSKGCELSVVGSNVAPEKFKFDHILTAKASQHEVYYKVLHPFLPLVFDGFDLFVVLYGSSEMGKSFTLSGSEESQGILPR